VTHIVVQRFFHGSVYYGNRSVLIDSCRKNVDNSRIPSSQKFYYQ